MDQGALSPAQEDYLQAIWRIEQRSRVARTRDVARAVGVAASAVTAAARALADKGLVRYEPYEPLTLTPEGEEAAERIVLCHRVIRDFLRHVLGIEQDRAEAVAWSMKHALDPATRDRFVCFLAYLRESDGETAEWLEQFHHFMAEGAAEGRGRGCIRRYLATLRAEEPVPPAAANGAR